eukprot:maker-scaffold_38-snap-gene-1.14-mRNA-1 protein AED:0.00 eAED:0.00 QI:94/1/1/1/0/0/2/600/214
MNGNSKEFLKQGSEAKVYVSEYEGIKCVIKQRLEKSYRHPKLELKLTKSRMNQEIKTLTKAYAANLPVPQIYSKNVSEKILILEYIPGNNLKTALSLNLNLDSILLSLGRILASLHSINLVHGDLTTSNVILKPGTEKLLTPVLIDFGLARTSNAVEDKGVELYVLKRAIIATHPEKENLFELFLIGYKETGDPEVIKRFEKVELRGRKRVAIG